MRGRGARCVGAKGGARARGAGAGGGLRVAPQETAEAWETRASRTLQGVRGKLVDRLSVEAVQIDRSGSRRVARTPKSIEVGRSGLVPTRSGAPKIDSKSVSGPSRRAPWCPRASPERLGSVSGAPRGIPGTPRERPERPQRHPKTPKRAPRSARERAEATKIDAKSHPGAKKPSFSRAARSRSIVGAMFYRFWSIFGVSAKSANP